MKYIVIILFNLCLFSLSYSQDSLSSLFKTDYQDLNFYLNEEKAGVFQFIEGGNRAKYLLENPAILHSDSAYLVSISEINRNDATRIKKPVYSDSSILLIPTSNIFTHLDKEYVLMNPVEKNNLSPTTDLSQSDILYLFRIDSNKYSYINSLNLSFPYKVNNLMVLPNLDDNFTAIINLKDPISQLILLWRLVEFDLNANIINVSDTIHTYESVKKILQIKSDSSYYIFGQKLNSFSKTNRNLDSIQVVYSSYPNESGTFFTSYQIPKIVDSISLFVHFRPDTSYDSSYIGIIKLESDSLIEWDTKNFTPNNYDVQMGFFNYSLLQSLRTYAYTTPRCIAILCQPNCINEIVVESYDLDNTLKWSKILGGDASYMIGGLLNTIDGGVLGTVIRYDTSQNLFGDFDTYNFYIDSNGQVVDNYLLLGLIQPFPQKVMEDLRLYPNPTTSQLTMVNTKIQSHAKKIIIYNIAGEAVMTIPFSKTINVQGLASGNYIYSLVLDNKEVINQKFSKF